MGLTIVLISHLKSIVHLKVENYRNKNESSLAMVNGLKENIDL